SAEAFPERVPTGRCQSKLAPYLPYLRQRWEQGCHKAATRARDPGPRISRISRVGWETHGRLADALTWATGAGTWQETTGSSSRQAPSVTPAHVLVVRQRPAAAHGRPAGAH